MTGKYNFKITLVHVISNAIKEYKAREEFMKNYLTRNSPLPKGNTIVFADKEMGLILGFCTFLPVFWSNHLTFQSLGFLIHRTMPQNQSVTCRVRVLILDQKTSKNTCAKSFACSFRGIGLFPKPPLQCALKTVLTKTILNTNQMMRKRNDIDILSRNVWRTDISGFQQGKFKHT